MTLYTILISNLKIIVEWSHYVFIPSLLKVSFFLTPTFLKDPNVTVLQSVQNSQLQL